MTKEIKDMTQEELRKMFAEKNTELYQLAKKVDEETDADILVFSLIGVNKEERTLSSNVVYGRSIGLANLLMEEEEYHEINKIITLYELQDAIENFDVENSESE